MTFAPGQLEAIDPARIDKDVASEILTNGQELLKSQLDSVDSLDGKLTTLLSQTATLATAALGAAGSAFWGSLDAKWIPPNLAAGLAAAGIVWLLGAAWALYALRPRRWSTAFFRPSKLANPKILNAASPALSYLAIALQLEAAIEQNDMALQALARDVYVVQWSLLAGVAGVVGALFIRG